MRDPLGGVVAAIVSCTRCSHWARKDRLEQLGAHYAPERVVERGKVITAAGISSGTDMGLVLVDRLFGSERAQLIKLGIEYDPQPPFDAGSPTKAPKDVVDVVRPLLADTLSDAAVAAVVADVRGSG